MKNKTEFDPLKLISGLEYSSSGSSWTRVLTLPEVGMQEGSGVRVRYNHPSDGSPRDQLWFAGGYPTDTGRVLVFDLISQTWEIPPHQQLPWSLHHCLQSMFYDEKNCRIVLLGGIRLQDGTHSPNNAALTLNMCGETDASWEQHDLNVGGIISCSVQTLLGKYWCYSGSNEYVSERFKFFSFDLESLDIEQYQSPKYETTHVSILVDEEHQLVYMSGGRDEGKNTVAKILSFDVQKKVWNAEEIDIPFVEVEDRGCIQLPNRKALLLGGQSTGERNVVTDIILEFDLSTRAIRLVDESPLPLFGEQIVNMKNGSYFIFSGASGVGPKYSRSSWLYSPKLSNMQRPMPGVPKVVDATCGCIPVTLQLNNHLENIVNRVSTKAPLYIPAAWCKEGLGPGNHDGAHALTILYHRDGKFYRSQCESYNSCLLRP
eukprot:jgi/Picre1/33167/NNA_008492.t1